MQSSKRELSKSLLRTIREQQFLTEKGSVTGSSWHHISLRSDLANDRSGQGMSFGTSFVNIGRGCSEHVGQELLPTGFLYARSNFLNRNIPRPEHLTLKAPQHLRQRGERIQKNTHTPKPAP